MKSYKNTNEYIKVADASQREQLKQVRDIIREAVPDAVEQISYGMPAYTWQQKPLFYFAAMKGHLGLYPTSGPIQTCAAYLTKFSTSKGCVRVSYSEKVPKSIIVKLLRARVNEIKKELSQKYA
jgi:uncharacterized protein YdhG (YjbR/CyaY superfamily)